MGQLRFSEATTLNINTILCALVCSLYTSTFFHLFRPNLACMERSQIFKRTWFIYFKHPSKLETRQKECLLVSREPFVLAHGCLLLSVELRKLRPFLFYMLSVIVLQVFHLQFSESKQQFTTVMFLLISLQFYYVTLTSFRSTIYLLRLLRFLITRVYFAQTTSGSLANQSIIKPSLCKAIKILYIPIPQSLFIRETSTTFSFHCFFMQV
jgi:hypothetical protein